VKLGDVVQDTHGVILVLDKQEQKVQSFGGKNGAGVEVPRETRPEFESNTKNSEIHATNQSCNNPFISIRVCKYILPPTHVKCVQFKIGKELQ